MVYIAPRSSHIGMATLSCRNPEGTSRKTNEIFEDRIFHDATNANQPTTPTQRLRSFKSLQTLSAPAVTRRNHRAVQNTILGPDHGLRADGPEPSSASRAVRPRGGNAHSAGHLRRRKTGQDLRSSYSVTRSDDSCASPTASNPKRRAFPNTRPIAVPLSSRTNQIQRQPSDHPVPNIPRKVTSFKVVSTEDPKCYSAPALVTQQLTKLSISQDGMLGGTELDETIKSPSPDIEMVDASSSSRWNLRNVHDHIGCPQDLQKAFVRSDTTPTKDLNPYVQRIDVTTRWKDVSPAAAEELFRIHIIFKDTLKAMCSEKVEGMLSLVKKNFFLKEGSFAYLDGFRVAVLDQWIRLDREQLVDMMAVLGREYFSQMEHQPNRSALMQLYLSSTECFLDWDKYEKRWYVPDTGVSMRTFYDQLSEFEESSARAASFSDYVRILDLNPTPREDEELIIVPQYNRDGIFVQTHYPEDVKYTMDTPVTWLRWDDGIRGFRGRVPTYSAFSDSFGFERGESEDGCVSHVLEIVLSATFQKCCATGLTHFERVVRMRLIFHILSKHPTSVEQSVYGHEQLQTPFTVAYWTRLPSSAKSSYPQMSQNGDLISDYGAATKWEQGMCAIAKRPFWRRDAAEDPVKWDPSWKEISWRANAAKELLDFAPVDYDVKEVNDNRGKKAMWPSSSEDEEFAVQRAIEASCQEDLSRKQESQFFNSFPCDHAFDDGYEAQESSPNSPAGSNRVHGSDPASDVDRSPRFVPAAHGPLCCYVYGNHCSTYELHLDEESVCVTVKPVQNSDEDDLFVPGSPTGKDVDGYGNVKTEQDMFDRGLVGEAVKAKTFLSSGSSQW